MAIYPKELEELLREYLSDGVITNAERQALINKAMLLGVDTNEFNLYITAREQKINQANEEAKSKLKGRECPHCGEGINDLSDKCPHCGKNITPQASEEVKDLINNLEDSLVKLKSGNHWEYRKNKAQVERLARQANTYYGSNPKIQHLLAEIKREVEAVEKSKIEAEKATEEAVKKAERAEKMQSIKDTVIDFVSNHKWLTAIIIIVIIGAIASLCESIKDAATGSTTENNPEMCIEAMEAAIDEGNPVKAESLYKKYTAEQSDLETGSIKVIEYYINNNEPEKAEAWLNAVGSSSESYKSKIADMYFESGEYKKAGKVLAEHDYISLEDAPVYIQVIRTMKKNGVSSGDIDAYIEGLVASIHSDYKTELRNTLTKAANAK